MSLVDSLLAYGKTMLTETELQRVVGARDYSLLHRAVEDMVADGLLAPVKSSKLNGRLPPLYNKYRVIKPKEDFAEQFKSIRRLNPALNIAGYLKRPELFRKHQEVVEGLSRYLWHSPGSLEQPMSRKERSFSVWGREKLLDNHFALVREVLKYNRLPETFLNFYDTPEPFFEYVHGTLSERITVLILENKDTWFTFRKLMRDTGKRTIAGTPLDVLLYGEGNKVSKRGALEDYNACMLGMMGDEEGQVRSFLYFGDLDLEGIRLFFRARKANPNLDIKPFAALYRLMLELADGVDLPESLDARDIEAPLEEFAALADLGGRFEAFRVCLEKGRYIPQEIVNYQVAAGILS